MDNLESESCKIDLITKDKLNEIRKQRNANACEGHKPAVAKALLEESDEEFLNQLNQIDLLTKKSKKKQSKLTKSKNINI